MIAADIAQPLLAMMGLTAIVWLYMYVRRLYYIASHRIDPQLLRTPQSLQATIPEHVQQAANNLVNLFEIPVLFYALCLLLIQLNIVDDTLLWGAWAFVGLRALHSLVQCSINIVNIRFTLYVLSCGALWFMLVRTALLICG